MANLAPGAAGVAFQGRGAVDDDGFDLEWQKFPMKELFVKLKTLQWGLTSAGAGGRFKFQGLEVKK